MAAADFGVKGKLMNHENQKQETPVDEESDGNGKLSFLHVFTSVLAAAVGVQSKKNQQKDFNAKGSIYIYIVAGVVFTVLFVLTVAAVVKTVLANAGM